MLKKQVDRMNYLKDKDKQLKLKISTQELQEAYDKEISMGAKKHNRMKLLYLIMLVLIFIIFMVFHSRLE